MPINETPTDDLTGRIQSDARWLDERTRPITISEVESLDSEVEHLRATFNRSI